MDLAAMRADELSHRTQRLARERFDTLIDLIESQTGIHLNSERQIEIETKIFQTISEHEIELINNCNHTPELLQKVINRITIGESSFFRNGPHFEALVNFVLPDIFANRELDKRIKIWCAGCSIGQEPYSIAITLKSKFPEIDRWKWVVVATDINTEYLEKAKQGIYHPLEMRGVNASVLASYFEKHADGMYRINDQIRERVVFEQFNLLDFPYQSATRENHDLVFCRNVLIYFNLPTANRVVREIAATIRPGGYLFVGHSESYSETESLKICLTNDTYYYRRDMPSRRVPSQRPARTSFLLIPGTGNRSIAPPANYRAARPRSSSLRPVSGNTRTKPTPKINSIPPERKKIADLSKLLKKVSNYANQGKLEKAETLLVEVAEGAGKLDPRVYFLIGVIANQKNETEKAIRNMKRAVFLDRDFALGHFYLAIIDERENKRESAKKHFRNVARLLRDLSDDTILDGAQDLPVGRLKRIVQAHLEEVDNANSILGEGEKSR